MIEAILWAAAICAVIAFLLLYRKDIGNAREGQAAKEALKDVVEASKPVSADERQRLRDKYKRS